MEDNHKNLPKCCQPQKKAPGFWSGLVFGLLPHSFCLGFLIFSILGTTVLSTFFRRFLLIPHFFGAMVVFSFLMAMISACFYLKKLSLFSLAGLKRKWRYLTTLFATTIVINILLVGVIFPKMANLGRRENYLSLATRTMSARVVLSVNIPCSGHASLIISELWKINGIKNVIYNSQGNFEVNYDANKIKEEQILEAPIFKTYPARLILGK